MPQNRGARKRVAEGVYQDAMGYEAVVVVGSGKERRQKSKRFKKATGMREMTAWQDKARGELRKKKPKVEAGTLGAWIREYLKGVTSMPSYEGRRADAEAWILDFGDRDPRSITRVELQQQMTAWRAAKVAGSTLNHRKTALKAVYALHLDEDDPNPVAKVSRFPEADIEPRAIAFEVIDEILATMVPSKTRAMLRVMRAAGHPFERQRQLKPLHVQLEQRRVFLVARKKGKGTKGKWVPLTDEAVQAYQEFIDADAWNGVSRASIYVSFQRGVMAANRLREKAGQPLLPPYRPYDLRHSFGTWAYAANGDIRAVAELLDCTVETALRYTLGAVPTRMQATVDALEPERKRLAQQVGTGGHQV
jgi:site-specific recombinase XerC